LSSFHVSQNKTKRQVDPDHILKNKAVVALVGGSHGAYTDNLCFFRCLAVHRGAPNVQYLETPAKTYYREYLQQQDMTPVDFKQRQLCFSKYGLEERLWHQSGGQTVC
jgi:hypothetical protein